MTFPKRIKPLILLGLVLTLVYVFGTYPVQAIITEYYQVSQSSDDCTKYSTTSFSLNMTEIRTGTYLTVVYNDNGILFRNISFPTHAVSVYRAFLCLRGLGYSGTESVKIFYEDSLTSSTFTDLTDFDSRTRSTTYITSTASTPSNTWRNFTISGLLFEWTMKEGWTAGLNLTLFFTHNTAAGYKRAYSYDGSTTYAPILLIEWLQNYYVTYYTNNSEASTFLSTLGLYLDNGTAYPIAEQTGGNSFLCGMNHSYYFRNWVSSKVGNISDNPYEMTVSNDYGNFTLWAYSDPVPITGLSFSSGLVYGAVILGFIAVVGAVALKKRH